MGKLTITSGPDAGKEIPLSDSQVLGRLSRCTIPLKDTRASREHARIYKRQGTFFIVDLDSKNGIGLNGQNVRKAQLSPGDVLQVGETWLKIEFEPEAVFEPEPVAPAAPAGASLDADVKVRGSSGVSQQPVRTSTQPRLGGRTQDNMTRTSLAWLRTDLSQMSGLYRLMLLLGFCLLSLGIGVLVFILLA